MQAPVCSSRSLQLGKAGRQGRSDPWRAPCAPNDEGEEGKQGKEEEEAEEDEGGEEGEGTCGASSRFESWRRQAGDSSHPRFLRGRRFLSLVFGGD